MQNSLICHATIEEGDNSALTLRRLKSVTDELGEPLALNGGRMSYLCGNVPVRGCEFGLPQATNVAQMVRDHAFEKLVVIDVVIVVIIIHLIIIITLPSFSWGVVIQLTSSGFVFWPYAFHHVY